MTTRMLLVAAVLLGMASHGRPKKVSAKEKAELVKAVLGHPLPQRAKELEGLGAEALPLLAVHLDDPALGFDAMITMFEMNREGALPLVFRAMPRVRPTVAGGAFRIGVELVGRKPVPFAPELHDGAVRWIEAGNTDSSTIEEAIRVVGMTGSPRDFPLLDTYVGKPSPRWRDNQLRNAAQAALARLGSAPHLEEISRELSAPVPAKPTLDEAMATRVALEKAAFCNLPRFIPLLCRHLEDPGLRMGDTGVFPAEAAVDALRKLEPDPAYQSIPEWKAWCAKH